MRIFVNKSRNTHHRILSDSNAKNKDFIIRKKKVAKIKEYWA